MDIRGVVFQEVDEDVWHLMGPDSLDLYFESTKSASWVDLFEDAFLQLRDQELE